MYKYIFTHTCGLKFVKDASAELQQKRYRYDDDEHTKNVKNHCSDLSCGSLPLENRNSLNRYTC